MDEIRKQGFEKWSSAYAEKARLMGEALARYNNGRLKSFICNLFMNNDLPTLKKVMTAGEKIPYVSPVETGPLFREVIESMQDVASGKPPEQ